MPVGRGLVFFAKAEQADCQSQLWLAKAGKPMPVSMEGDAQ
jgi:hypothetical protein